MKNSDYKNYKSETKKLKEAVNKTEIALKLVSDAKTGGLPSDAVRSSKEYKKANLELKLAFAAYRAFNQKTPKAFHIRASKERRLEMMNR